MSGDDEQERADRLYDLFHSPRWGELTGRGIDEIRRLVGLPSEVWLLEHEGHTWKQWVYRFEAIPGRATEEERTAIRKGMEFTPVLWFRDGVCVASERFDDEVLRGPRASIPKHLHFRRVEGSSEALPG